MLFTGSPLICQRLNSVGLGTFPALRGLPRFHRANPSTALDECFVYSTMRFSTAKADFHILYHGRGYKSNPFAGHFSHAHPMMG